MGNLSYGILVFIAVLSGGVNNAFAQAKKSGSSGSSGRTSSGSGYGSSKTTGSATFGGGYGSGGNKGGYGNYGGGGYGRTTYEQKSTTPSAPSRPAPSAPSTPPARSWNPPKVESAPAPKSDWSRPKVEETPKATPKPTPAPERNTGWGAPKVEETPKASPKPTPAPERNTGWGAPKVEEQPKKQTPREPKDWSYGGKANGTLGNQPSAPAPRPSIKDAPWAKRASDVPPRTTNSNPYQGRTDTKTNKDGSTTTRYYDENNKLRETEVTKNGRVVKNFKRDDDGNETHTYANSSKRVIRSGNIETTEFSDGRRIERNKVIDPRTGNTKYYRNGSRQFEEYRNEKFRDKPVEVYVNRNESFLEQPWFWLYLMERNRQNANNSNGGSNSGGGGYGGGSGNYNGGSYQGPSTPAAPMIKQDWSTLYEKLPAKYAGEKSYASGDDYITDFVTFGLINDNRPSHGFWDTHFCWFHTCVDESKDYDIELQTRTLMKAQVQKTLVDLKDKKDINLYKMMGEQGLDPAAKGYLVIANDSADAKLTADQSRCSIESGAILSLNDYSNDSGYVTATVVEQGGEPAESGDEEECGIGKQVLMDATLAQKYQNEFLRLLDTAVSSASTKLSSSKR